MSNDDNSADSIRWVRLKNARLAKLEKHFIENKVDKPAINIINIFNSSKVFFTSSSCSGRVMLLEIKESKKDAKIYWKEHEPWPLGKLSNSINEYINNSQEKKNLWLHVQGFIFHVYCYNQYYAEKLLDLLITQGFKRAGIIKLKEFPIIEFISTNYLSMPIYINNKLIVPFENFYEIEKLALELLNRNLNRLNKFEKELVKFIQEIEIN
ncbi:MAG: hypothetical protein QXF76_00130 [Candidatus Anstonellales archaeon]